MQNIAPKVSETNAALEKKTVLYFRCISISASNEKKPLYLI